MTRRVAGRTRRLVLFGLLLGSAAAAAAAAPGLRHDPFIRPPLVAGSSKPSAAAPGAAAETPAMADAAPAWQSDLRGVMLAGDASVANVAGSIVAIGETIDGWRLVQVGDGNAVFAKARKRLLLTMNNAGQQKK